MIRLWAARGLTSLALFLAVVGPLVGQESGSGSLGAQNLRPFGFVFAAYALAWLMVLGWIVSVGRRLARLDRAVRD